MAVTGPGYQQNALSELSEPSEPSGLSELSQLENLNLNLRIVDVRFQEEGVVAVQVVAAVAVFLLFAVSSFPAAFVAPGCWDVY